MFTLSHSIIIGEDDECNTVTRDNADNNLFDRSIQVGTGMQSNDIVTINSSNERMKKGIVSGALVLAFIISPIKPSSYGNITLLNKTVHTPDLSGIKGINYGNNSYISTKEKRVITMMNRDKKVTPIKLVVQKAERQRRNVIMDDLYEDDIIVNRSAKKVNKKVTIKIK